VLVDKVDVIGGEPLQRTLDRDSNILRAAIEGTRTARHVGDPAKLRCEHDLVPVVLDRPADELLVGERTVRLRGVEERDTKVVEQPSSRNRRLPVPRTTGWTKASRHTGER
jgi:hypothetical protein